MQKKALFTGVLILLVFCAVVYLMYGRSNGPKPESVPKANPIVSGSEDSANKAKPSSETAVSDVSKDQTIPSPAPAAESGNSSAADSLIGTWVSAVQGKGMQASGKVETSRATTQLNLSGDIVVVIDKVSDNIASGTITYNNLCSTSIVSVPGKTEVSEPPQCIDGNARPVSLQISGNTLKFDSTTATGGDISFVGNYTKDTVSGTFTRASSYGKLDGTFSLVRAKK
jgi:hypothetical protein